MYQTRATLINRVLKEIGQLQAGQTASAEDAAAVDEIIDDVLTDLRQRGVVDVTDAGDPGPTGGSIDSTQFLHLVRIIGEYAAPAYGRSADQATIEFAEQKLRVQQAPAVVSEPVRAEYF